MLIFCYSLEFLVEIKAIIFKGTSSLDNIWDRISFLVSLWCSANGRSLGVCSVDMQSEWYANMGQCCRAHVFFFFLLVSIFYTLYALFSFLIVNFLYQKQDNHLFDKCFG